MALKLWLELKDAGGISGSEKEKGKKFRRLHFLFCFLWFLKRFVFSDARPSLTKSTRTKKKKKTLFQTLSDLLHKQKVCFHFAVSNQTFLCCTWASGNGTVIYPLTCIRRYFLSFLKSIATRGFFYELPRRHTFFYSNLTK